MQDALDSTLSLCLMLLSDHTVEIGGTDETLLLFRYDKAPENNPRMMHAFKFSRRAKTSVPLLFHVEPFKLKGTK